ncbi:uncharacterized protein BBA_07279 [Beauveria bassiana ARSEF 2860]|uniref:Uncharacterized protein n=1 Tax=Beauveria bassiana (strain ARSEF 2860) TaxID=655819 RepID=J4VZ97_BEAB2|nr:uncharacterized protein BBA_07279 [Beauveria bassiana ARSEF 2860]EJP63635.1 hypothetical protein BBA_07279 [Beauveria bassiana ARSEF 2860]
MTCFPTATCSVELHVMCVIMPSQFQPATFTPHSSTIFERILKATPEDPILSVSGKLSRHLNHSIAPSYARELDASSLRAFKEAFLLILAKSAQAKGDARSGD